MGNVGRTADGRGDAFLGFMMVSFQLSLFSIISDTFLIDFMMDGDKLALLSVITLIYQFIESKCW